MSSEERSILDQLNADNRAALYRCRWSSADAEAVVPKLITLLSSDDGAIVDEALRALFCVGTPAQAAASAITPFMESSSPITRQLALLTLGQVAHKKPELCVPAATSALRDDDRCRDAMRILAFIGPSARSALPPVIEKFSHSDAKVRKAALITAIAIAPHERAVMDLVKAAASDRSKIVRSVAEKRILNENV